MLACNSRKFGAAIVGAAIILAGTSVDCYSQTGSIHLTVVKAGVVVSTGSGTGTLDYQGRTYPLSVSSFGLGTIGVSGDALVGGQVARFQNTKGVILELVGPQLGLSVSLGSAGMTIALQAP